MTPLVVCIGGINRDTTLRLMHDPVPGASNRVSAAPAAGGHAAGGVARNVAEMLARLGVQAHLIGAVGNDPQGRAVLRETAAAGVNVDHVLVCDDIQTGGYTAVLDPRGELFIGLADTGATEKLTPDMLAPKFDAISGDGLVFADTNLAAGTLEWLIRHCASTGVPLAIDMVSPEKAVRLTGRILGIATLFGNRGEATALLGADAPVARLARQLVSAGARRAVVTDGPGTLAFAEAFEQHDITPEPVEPVDVSGAGDALISGFLAGHLAGLPTRRALEIGMAVARATVLSPGRVACNQTLENLLSSIPTEGKS